jgi:hypothetical protein
MNNVFAAIFTLEAMVKLLGIGGRYVLQPPTLGTKQDEASAIFDRCTNALTHLALAV